MVSHFENWTKGLPVAPVLVLVAVAKEVVVVAAVTKEEALGAMGGLPFLFYTFFLTCLLLNLRGRLLCVRGDFR